ncbi:MAG: hypothetical protein IK083_00110 [Abditibacteriota bacterium]|nr:hypothetical protein [Abditibacteriota bacterium]
MKLSDNRLYSFYIGNTADDEYIKTVDLGNYFFCCDDRTPLQIKKQGSRILVLFGDCVNVITGSSEDLPGFLLTDSAGVEDIVEKEKVLGGKYIILYKDDVGCNVIGDASGSIPVFYSTTKSCCSDNKKKISEVCALEPDSELTAIRKSGDISQAMPYDITEYRKIKRLLPNHRLDLTKKQACRFINAKEKQSVLTPKAAAETTLPYIRNIAKYYHDTYKIYVPVTGGYDSRVVLAVFYALDKDTEAYTIRHSSFSGDEQDITIPTILCHSAGIKHRQITDKDFGDDLLGYMESLLGKDGFSQRTLMIANTIFSEYGGGLIVNGDIMGQVGKCSLHRDIPGMLAGAGYFRCKLHNYSKESIRLLNDWLKDIKGSGEKVNPFDLFSIESRVGRWAGQENLIYNAVGQRYANIFNSRSIIYAWTAVERKYRKKTQIHKELIRAIAPDILSTPFGTDSLAAKISKSSGIVYYLSSLIKYKIEEKRFYHGR